MSIGPPALGNVLVQRLDAVLGTTMAAHANLLTGARPDAVGQPGEAARAGQTENATRDPRQPVDGVGARGDRQAAVVDAKTAAALALAARGLVTRSDTTASAPTTLGTTAR
ncbi:flagellar hook-length control protein FliK, partial [Bordetella hinzii]